MTNINVPIKNGNNPERVVSYRYLHFSRYRGVRFAVRLGVEGMQGLGFCCLVFLPTLWEPQ